MPFRKGFDMNRYQPNNKQLTKYKMDIRTMLSKQLPALQVVEYLHGIMVHPDTSSELRCKVAIDIMDRVLGKAIPMDRLYDLEQRIAADKSLAHFTNDELEQKLSDIYAELDSRVAVAKVLDNLEQSQQ